MLLEMTKKGLYCSKGSFYIDPTGAVERAVVTHAHADHARPGSTHYLCAPETVHLLKDRIGADISVQALPYGERLGISNIVLSLHPSGHMLGAAQVKVEQNGEAWVVTGDYKRTPDPTCLPFEPLRAHVLVTECTFGLPVFTWPPADQIISAIIAWWETNARAGRTSLLLVYAFGKAQRIIAELGLRESSLPGDLFGHWSVLKGCDAYRKAGVILNEMHNVKEIVPRDILKRALVMAPPSALGTAWVNRLRPSVSALASGWIADPQYRKRTDDGFVLSDHADWDDILGTVRESGAQQVYLVHGYTETLARYLREDGGVKADAFP